MILANVTSLVSKTILEFTNATLNRVENAINRFLNRLSVDVAPCKPVWKVVTGIASVPCSMLVDPLNGYWFEIGGFLGVGVVTLIFAVKVAGLLRDEVQAEEDEDQVFDATPNHVIPTKTKNQVSHQSPPKTRHHHNNNNGNVMEMREYENGTGQQRPQYRHPPPYEPDHGVDENYRSTDNIYRDSYDNKPYSYVDGHVNGGYRHRY
jgi:hypothetical protein